MGFLTLVCLVAIMFGIVTRRWGLALAVGSATPAGVSAVVAGVGIPTFFTIGLAAALWMVLDAVYRRWQDKPRVARARDIPGVVPLVAFTAWSIFCTIAATFLFDGTVLISPVDQVLTTGVITTRNLAQIGYLVIGVAIVVLLARSPYTSPNVLGLALVLPMALSFWRFLSQQYGLPFLDGVFDNSPTYVFIETAPGGALRFRGIFSEPSSLATVAILAIVFGLIRAYQVRGLQRLGWLALAAASTVMGFASTSTTFIVAGVAIVVIALVTQTVAFLSRKSRFGVGAGIIGCSLVVVAAFALPAITAAVSGTVQQKVGTFSYLERSSVDEGLLASFFDTGGFGVGLGAARGSSFLTSLLATVGVIGTVLFAAALVIIVRRSQNVRSVSPVLWSLIALLVVKLISGPELSDTHGLLWLCLGILAHAGLRRRSGSGSDSGLPSRYRRPRAIAGA